MQKTFPFPDKLTALNRKLLWFAKSIAREQGYHCPWCSDGKVFVRKELGARPIRIASEQDLEQMD